MEQITSLGIWLIPIVAIIVGGLTGITKMVLTHMERGHMIDRGMDPDAPHRKSASPHFSRLIPELGRVAGKPESWSVF